MSRPTTIVMDWGVDTAPGSSERCYSTTQTAALALETIEFSDPHNWRLLSFRIGNHECLTGPIVASDLRVAGPLVVPPFQQMSFLFKAIRYAARFRAVVRAMLLEEAPALPLAVPKLPGFTYPGPRAAMRWLLVWSCEDFETFEGLAVVRSDQGARLEGLIVLATFDQEAPALAAVEGGIAFAPGLDTTARAWMVAALLGAELDTLEGHAPRSRVHHEPVRRALGLPPEAPTAPPHFASFLPMNNPRESDR